MGLAISGMIFYTRRNLVKLILLIVFVSAFVNFRLTKKYRRDSKLSSVVNRTSIRTPMSRQLLTLFTTVPNYYNEKILNGTLQNWKRLGKGIIPYLMLLPRQNHLRILAEFYGWQTSPVPRFDKYDIFQDGAPSGCIHAS